MNRTVKLRSISLPLALVSPPRRQPTLLVLLASNGAGVGGIMQHGGGPLLYIQYRVLMESYGTSILRQGVMHRGECGGMTEALV